MMTAEGTEIDIAQAKGAKRADGILYDYLRENCTLDQIVMLSKVLMDVDKGCFGRTRNIMNHMHAVMVLALASMHIYGRCFGYPACVRNSSIQIPHVINAYNA